MSNSPDPSLNLADDGEEQVDELVDRLFRIDPNIELISCVFFIIIPSEFLKNHKVLSL